MTAWLFLIDDAHESLTQRAVLAGFADALAQRPGTFVCLTSALRPSRRWVGVPAAASHRLAARIFALGASQGSVSVFVPGHVVPGAPGPFARPTQAISAQRFTTVADLDLFVVDNASPEVAQFAAQFDAQPDYESTSRYTRLSAGPLPAWLLEGGLQSLPLYTQRPWYCALAPTRTAWLAAVGEALGQGTLTLAQVEQDVHHGLVRPSLLEDARRLAAGAPAASLPWPDRTLDALFVVPECRPTAVQRHLLRSSGLHARLKAHAGRDRVRKPWRERVAVPLRRVPGLLRRPVRWGMRLLRVGYAWSLRPLVQRLRAAGASRP